MNHRVVVFIAAAALAASAEPGSAQPLSGAEVRFVPLPALQDVLPIGTGATDSDGVAMISAAEDELPSAAPKVAGLMPPGLYLVEVTHPTTKIPEKYNRQTVLGKEVSRRHLQRMRPR